MIKIVALLFAVLPVAAWTSEPSPYAGQQLRSVKSLSQNEIASLRRGDGMGFAKLAELNHFPGPKHVLEISDELGLSQTQLNETNTLFEEMHRNAVLLGERLVKAEAALDQQFAQGSITAESLQASLQDIGSLRLQLRYVHLEAHLRQKQVLSEEQILKYDAIRGYHGALGGHDKHHVDHE